MCESTDNSSKAESWMARTGIALSRLMTLTFLGFLVWLFATYSR